MRIETERLEARRLAQGDFDAIFPFMSKPEVMYAWEHGFSEAETREWIEKQLVRYESGGFGYCAVILKETGRIIGQAGLLKTQLNGQDAVEVGYIFDIAHWGQGYATEIAAACVDYGFAKLNLDAVYAKIRPENPASVAVAHRLGMKEAGVCVIQYNGRDMLHTIFCLRRNEWKP